MNYISGLDWLKFLMCVFIAIYHFVLVNGLTETSLILKLIANSGFYATSTFFILSGFILSAVYKQKITTDNLNKIDFIIKRLSSIYPLHLVLQIAFVVLLLASILILGKVPAAYTELETFEVVGYFIRSAFLLHAWEDALLLNQPSWSLSALYFFYIVFVFSKKILLSPKIFVLLIGLWGLYLIPPAIYYYYPDTIFSYTMIHKNPLLRLPEFLSGVVAYNLFQKYQSSIHLSYIIFGIFGFLVTAMVVLARPQYLPFFHNGLVLPFQIALILGCTKISFQGVNTKLIGGLALPIFMTHLLVLNVMDFVLPEMPIYLALLLNIAMVILVSYMSYVYFSQPLQKIIRRKFIKNQGVGEVIIANIELNELPTSEKPLKKPKKKAT